MAAMAGALSVATTALSAAQAVHTYQVGKVNVKTEKKLGEIRDEARRDKLKRTLASQRIALAQQGTDPDFGSSLVLYDESRRLAERDSSIDRLETDIAVKNIKAKGTTALLKGASRASTSLLSASKAKEQQAA